MKITYYLVIVLTLLFFVLRLFRSRIRGKAGEKTVASILDSLPGDKYRIFNNVILPTPKGSSQIDHLVVSIYGIFVIETKNLNGWIYGGEHSEYWTQNIYGRKYQFYNPILQNERHIRALRRVLKDFEPLSILSIVSFSGKADIKVNVKEACVTYWGQILQVIHQFDEYHLSWEQVDAICEVIQSVQVEPGRKAEKKHIQDSYLAREKKLDIVASGRCPRCGGTITIRTGKYGRFYGCSNYPQCRYTYNID